MRQGQRIPNSLAVTDTDGQKLEGWMSEPVRAVNYIALGRLIGDLRYPYDQQVRDVVDNVAELVAVLQNLGYRDPIPELQGFSADLQAAYRDNPDSFSDKSLGFERKKI